ncbi:MAG: hypothetical protein C0392_12305 [Syntrophus sp. (in: bacteria)]|nr:hypothetical protein [Syntrophus sp. (in: bacteria)]
MKRLWTVILAVAMVITVSSFVLAQKEDSKKKVKSKPGIVVADVVAMEATVEAVDSNKRTLTLKGPEGNTRTFKVGKEIKNFDQIKAGDKVKAEYFESIAVFVRKSDAPATAGEMAEVDVAPKGKKPAAFAIDVVEVTAKVTAIDYKKRTVTLKGPEGNVRTFPVDKRVKNFKQVKVGDEVVIRHTEALAISVVKS